MGHIASFNTIFRFVQLRYKKYFTHVTECSENVRPELIRNQWRSDAAEIRFLPSGHFDFESGVTAKSDEYKISFDSSCSRSLTSKLSPETQYLASILSNTFVKYICRNISCALGKWSLQSRWKSMVTNADKRKWRQIRISAGSAGQGETKEYGAHHVLLAWVERNGTHLT